MVGVGGDGSDFVQGQEDGVVKAGEEITIAGYKLVYFGNIDRKYPDTEIITSQLQVWHDGKLQQYIYPGRQFYANFGNQPASIISITTYGLTDLYVFLAEWTGPSEATIRVFVNPLVPLVWLGGLVMVLGGIICWWPERRRRRVVFSEAVGEPEAEPAMAGAAPNGKGPPRSAVTHHEGR